MIWFALASLSAVLSAAAAITQKKILFRVSALEFSFLVSILILALSSFVPIFVDVTSIPTSVLLFVLGKSILGGTAFLLVMMALQHNQISDALPLLGLTPAVTALAALLLIGESLRDWEWLGIGMMVAGTYILERKPFAPVLQPIREIFLSRNRYYIFGALGLFALSSVADKMLVSGYKIDPLALLFYQHIVYALLFGSLLLVRSSSFGDVVQKSREHFPLILAVAVLTIAYRVAQLEATKIAPVALVLAVKRTSIVYASFFGGRMFSDERLPMKLCAGAIIVAAGFFILRNVG
jgi:drug/metabolite transporter (DMT)-like permease